MYAKVFAQIYDGTLCTRGPWQALVTFQQMLILADQDGNVDMTAAAISRRTTIPLDIINMGLQELLLPDPESRTPTEEGRRLLPLSESRSWGWHVVNYKHYRALKREEDRREYHREYWHKRKEKELNQDSTPTQHAQPNQPIAEAKAEAKAKKEPKGSSVASFEAPEWVPAEQWKSFVQMRKAMRGVPFTEAASKGVIRELEKFAKLGHDPESLLDAAVMNGWRTVYEPKGSFAKKSEESPWRREQRERMQRDFPSIAARAPCENASNPIFEVEARNVTPLSLD